MKKTIFVMLALVIVAACGVGVAYDHMSGLWKNIKMTETTIFGDRQMADGLQVTSSYLVDYDIPNWKVTYDFGSKKVIGWNKAEKEITINRDDADIFLCPVEVWYESAEPGIDALAQRVEAIETQTGISKNDILAAAETAEKGKRTKEIFYFKDYMERLPVMLILSGIDLHLDVKVNRTKMDIPVPEGAKLVLEIKKNEKGDVTWWELYSDFETLYIESDGAFDEEWLYLAVTGIGVEVYGEEEKLIYTKHLYNAGVETHGVHKMPFNYGEQNAWANLDQAELVYPLEAGEQVMHLAKSHDEKNLLLFTKIDGNLYLSVIEKATMNCSQKMLLIRDAGEFFEVMQKENFFLYLDDRKQFAVIDTSAEIYRLHFTGTLEMPLDDIDELDAVFNGDRFAIAYYPR
ncbi:MAG: hypothetical protein IKI99_03600, partial [Firmicutes bacterium]|nr:hypothetical protein [Bacillota bacterium]